MQLNQWKETVWTTLNKMRARCVPLSRRGELSGEGRPWSEISPVAHTPWMKPTILRYPLWHSTWISVTLILLYITTCLSVWLAVWLAPSLHALTFNSNPIALSSFKTQDWILAAAYAFRIPDYNFRQCAVKVKGIVYYANGSQSSHEIGLLCSDSVRHLIHIPPKSISSVSSIFLFHRNTELSFKVVSRLV
jgi:hypothetical protein